MSSKVGVGDFLGTGAFVGGFAGGAWGLRNAGKLAEEQHGLVGPVEGTLTVGGPLLAGLAVGLAGAGIGYAIYDHFFDDKKK